MKIAVFSAKDYDKKFFEAHKQSGQAFDFMPMHLSAQTAVLAAGYDAVCCFVNDCLDATVLSQLQQQGITQIALRCAGFNNVDLDAAKTLGIQVCRVPEYSPHAVAEHAVALILDLNRNIHRAHNRVRENNYSLDGLLGFDLYGKTVGVIGAGKIGTVFIQIMRGFGCQVLVHDPFVAPQQITEIGATATSLHNLWQQADIVSLHCPLTPETQHIINSDSIAAMKSGVMIINTGRGGLVDTQAVIKGLKTGQIGFLGLDVYEEESDIFFEDLSNQVIQDDVFARLQTFPNVTITGHQAFFTHEALTNIAEVTCANLAAMQQGAPIAANQLA